jgi:hypothetical protein
MTGLEIIDGTPTEISRFLREENPICKCCGDDNSHSLSNKGWCIYCERAYILGLEKQKQKMQEKIEDLAHDYSDKSVYEFVEKLKEIFGEGQ